MADTPRGMGAQRRAPSMGGHNFVDKFPYTKSKKKKSKKSKSKRKARLSEEFGERGFGY